MNKKKLLALLMALVMTLSLVPVTAFAEGDQAAESTTGYAGEELPAGPDMSGNIINVTAVNAQYVLDGAYGNINGKTINFTENVTDALDLARPTKYSGSGTTSTGTYKTYSRTLSNVTFTAESGVQLAGFYFHPGHIHGNDDFTKYNYVEDRPVTSVNDGYYRHSTLSHITFSGLTVIGSATTAPFDFIGSLDNATVSEITFNGCTITNNNGNAIQFNNNGNLRYGTITISNCNINGSGMGVYVNSAGDGTITLNNNIIFGGSNNAIQITRLSDGTGSVSITGNYLKSNKYTVNLNNYTSETITLTGNAVVAGTRGHLGHFKGDASGNFWAPQGTTLTENNTVTTTLSSPTADTKAEQGENEITCSSAFDTALLNTSADKWVTLSNSASTAVAQIGSQEYETLQAAITAAQSGDTVNLLQNVSENVTVAADKDIAIDLAGHTINGGTVANSPAITNNGTLEIKDTVGGGVVKREDTGSSGYYVIDNAGELTVTSGTYTNGTGSTSEHAGASLIRTQETATLNIDGGTLDQQYFNVIKDEGGIVNITGGTINCAGAEYAILTYGELNISGGNINGPVDIRGYRENNVDSVGEATISGGIFNSKFYVEQYTGYHASTNPSLIIEGGQFTTDAGTFNVGEGKKPSNFTPDSSCGTIVISGGIFSSEPAEAYIANGYEVVNNDDETYQYKVQASAVAEVNGTQYETLAEAFAAANTAGTATIKVLRDCTLDNTVTVQAGKNVTLNLDGNTVGSTMDGATADDVMIAIEAGATMTVTGNGVITNQVDGTTYSKGLIHNAGTLTVNGGTFNDYGQGCGYALKNSGTMTVKTGTRIESFGTASGNAAIYNVTGELNIEDGVTIVNHATDGVVDEDRYGKNGYGVYAIRIDAGTTTIGTLNATNPTSIDGNRGAFAVNSGALVINSGVFKGHIYRAMWITNDYLGTSVTINGGTFLPGNSGSVGANVDDSNQDRCDVAVTVNDGYFAGSFYRGNKDSNNEWTFAIKGGCYTVAPSANLIADGYKAVAISKTEGGITYNWQVGEIKATDLTPTSNNGSTATFTATTKVVDEDNEIIGNSEITNLNVTVTGYTGAETNTVAQATLGNVMSNELQTIVSDAIVAAGSGITSNTTQANVVIQVAKSAPNTSTQGKVSYEVHPEAVISVNNVKVGTVPLTNDQIDGTFTFKLNVSSIANPGEYVRIDHVENNAVLDSKTYRVGDDYCVEISGITRFSIFVGEKVNEQNGYFTYLGASVRRRVQTSSPKIVVNTCTDMRFGFVVKDYNSFSSNDKYYFQWKKEGGTWSSPVEIINFDYTGGECVASLVITNIPQSFFDTKITAMIYKEGEAGNAQTGGNMSVRDVANAIITKYGNGTSQKQWVDYARYLTTQNGSYTVDYDENDQYVIGYTYTAQ